MVLEVVMMAQGLPRPVKNNSALEVFLVAWDTATTRLKAMSAVPMAVSDLTLNPLFFALANQYYRRQTTAKEVTPVQPRSESAVLL